VSTLLSAPRSPRGRTAVALLTAFALAFATLLGGALGLGPTQSATAAEGPAITATPAPRDGGTVTVTGTGFAAADPGIYLGVGPVGLAGFYQGSSSLTDIVWVAVGNASANTDQGRTEPMAEDGSFSLTVTVPAWADGTQYAIYASKAHGQGFSDPSQNVVAAIDWAAAPTPQLAVSKTSDLDPDGAEITITGTDYATEFHPSYSPDSRAGVYLQVGYIDASWRPSESAASATRSTAFTAAIGDHVDEVTDRGTYVQWQDNGDGTADFSWTVTIDEATLETKAREGATLAVFTVGAGGVVQAVNELAVPIAFATATTPGGGEPGDGEEPGDGSTPPVTTPTQAGSLSWGIKSSFRDYVTGPIAAGSVTVSGVSTSGGAYVFPQSTSLVDQATGNGSVSYTGSVRFVGHGGVLDIKVADPIVTITSPSTATLSVLGYSGRIVIANLALAAGSRSESGGAVTYAGVPATLTVAGAGLFQGNYPAGTALDAVTFTIGAAATASTGGSRTVAAYVDPASTARTPADTPPATDGIEIDSDVLTPGQTVTLGADGFEPGETGILLVAYSTPRVLADDLVADASGRVTWTGALPADLVGEHTLTFQGSVNRGVVVRIGATSVQGCMADGATLDWGFKESFRSYLLSSIANGSWELADGATYTTPEFGWSGGTGAYDPDTHTGLVSFTGSVRFLGHDGALDVTIANPQLQFVDATTAYLLLDVTGTNDQGQAISGTTQFATLTLSGDELAGGVLSGTAIPAALTADGHTAFPDYAAGEALDPVTFSITLPSDCGVAAAATPEPVDAVVASGGSDAAPTAPWGWIIAGIVLVLLVIAALVWWLAARRRAAAA